MMATMLYEAPATVSESTAGASQVSLATENNQPDTATAGPLPSYDEAVLSPPSYIFPATNHRSEITSLTNELVPRVLENARVGGSFGRNHNVSNRVLLLQSYSTVNSTSTQGGRHSIAVPYTIPVRSSRNQLSRPTGFNQIDLTEHRTPPSTYRRSNACPAAPLAYPALGHQIGNGVIILLLQSTAVVCFVLGAVFCDMCPAEPKIPIYMMCMGGFLFLTTVLWFCSYLHDANCRWLPNQRMSVQCTKMLFFLVVCLDISWLIVGTYWVFSVFKQVRFSSSQPELFCDETLYATSFLFNVVSIILLCVITCTLIMTNATKLS